MIPNLGNAKKSAIKHRWLYGLLTCNALPTLEVQCLCEDDETVVTWHSSTYHEYMIARRRWSKRNIILAEGLACQTIRIARTVLLGYNPLKTVDSCS